MEVLKKQPSAKGPVEMFTGEVYFDVIYKAKSRPACGSTLCASPRVPAPPGTPTPLVTLRDTRADKSKVMCPNPSPETMTF